MRKFLATVAILTLIAVPAQANWQLGFARGSNSSVSWVPDSSWPTFNACANAGQATRSLMKQADETDEYADEYIFWVCAPTSGEVFQ